MEPLIRTGGENSTRARMIHSQVCAVGHPHHTRLVRKESGPQFGSPLRLGRLVPKGCPVSSGMGWAACVGFRTGSSATVNADEIRASRFALHANRRERSTAGRAADEWF